MDLRLAGSWAVVSMCAFAVVSGCSASSNPASSGRDASLDVGDAADDVGSGLTPTEDAGAASDAASTGDDGRAALDDGAIGDGAAGDGARDYSTDRAQFFGDSRCADAGFQLCEDFESGKLNPAIWTIGGTAPVVDELEHARGTHALHILPNDGGLSSIKEKMTFPEPNDTYFGRMFVYFKSLPSPPGMTYAHWTIVAASGTGVPGEIRVSGQLQQSKNLFGVGTDNRTDGGSGDWTNSDDDPNGKPVAVPVGQWMCIEWMHKGDTSETAFWWDGVPHPSLSTVPTTPHGGNPMNPFFLPQFTEVWLGWTEYQPSGEVFESWIDEIAIDSQRIGCVL